MNPLVVLFAIALLLGLGWMVYATAQMTLALWKPEWARPAYLKEAQLPAVQNLKRLFPLVALMAFVTFCGYLVGLLGLIGAI